jgi:hypothetical protein
MTAEDVEIKIVGGHKPPLDAAYRALARIFVAVAQSWTTVK